MANGLHHLHISRQLRNRARRHWFDYLMLVIGLLAPLALLPQVITLYTLHDASGLAIQTWELLFAINVLWAVYSVKHKEIPLFFMSSSLAILDAIMVIGIVAYS